MLLLRLVANTWILAMAVQIPTSETQFGIRKVINKGVFIKSYLYGKILKLL